MRHAKPLLLAAACSAGAVGGQPAAAQGTAQGRNAPIIVTAQRRPELAEDVPISLSVRSGEALERLQVSELGDLNKVVPGLVIPRAGAFTQPYLRGVGKRSNVGVENGVATYVDGVYMASSIGLLLDLHGIERVEVLAGPQGTLFGRNTTGGVIQVITRDPSPEEAGTVEAHAGSYGYLRGDGYLTGGSESLAGNLAVSLSRNGGYGINLFTGKHDQGEVDHNVVARTKWLLRPTSQVKVTLAADWQDTEHDFAMRPLEGYPPIGQPRVIGFRDGDQDASNRYHFRYGGVSLKAEAALGALTLLSLSAARRMRANWNNDLDQGPQPLISGHPTATQKQFSQEFQLQSNPAGRIAWLAGLYYFYLEEQVEPLLFRYGGSYSAQLGGRVRRTLFSTGKVSSYAAYGQATASLGDHTRLTGGLRYTLEHRSVEAFGEQEFDAVPFVRPIPGLPLPAEAPLEDSNTFREMTWRASLDRDLSDTLLSYFSVSRGFQSGGWNLQTPQFAPFAPETLDALEGGLKFAAASGRLKVDASAFYYDYSDIQVSAFTPVGSMTTNATSAEIYGLQLQLEARPYSRTSVNAGAQLLEAQYGAFRNATCFDPNPAAAVRYAPIQCDASGNRLPFAPAFKANLAISHEVSLGRSGALTLSGNVAYSSLFYTEADNLLRQPGYATLDLSAEWRPSGDDLALRLWVRNATDAEYDDSVSSFPTVAILHRPTAPRRFGISLAYGF